MVIRRMLLRLLTALLVAACAAACGPRVVKPAQESWQLSAPVDPAIVVTIAPGTIDDPGADLKPAHSGDGFNDTKNIPIAECPLPGVGRCYQPVGMYCGLKPQSGVDLSKAKCDRSASCNGGAQERCCKETWIGPSGVTPADKPHGTLTAGACTIALADKTKPAPLKDFRVMCSAEGISWSGPVTTAAPGTCYSGPEKGKPCGSDADCSDDYPFGSMYPCTSGDEYYCGVRAVVTSNLDHKPEWGGPCLVASVKGEPGDTSGCGKPALASCYIGSCIGGPRDGQACDWPSNAMDCEPGGACSAKDPASMGQLSVELTGDEYGTYVPAFGATQYVLSPFLLEMGLPMEVKNGKADAATNLAIPPFAACIPPDTEIANADCFIHEPAQTGPVVPLGLYFSVPPSSGPVPCPDLSYGAEAGFFNYPLPVGAVGPVIGVGGL